MLTNLWKTIKSSHLLVLSLDQSSCLWRAEVRLDALVFILTSAQ